MNNTTDLVKSIIEGIQEKKGRDIAVANLTKIATAPCDYFVICTCGSPQQVDAVTDSVEEFTGKQYGEHPTLIAGRQNAVWVAMDYGTVMVHIFVPETREHYDLEHLWEDAKLEQIPNIDRHRAADSCRPQKPFGRFLPSKPLSLRASCG